jgi:lysozyme
MTASENGISIIKNFEGLRLHAYKDPGSKDGLPITIGYGSTMYKDGSKIKLGDTITQDQANDLLMWEVGNKTQVLNGLNLKLNQNQFDAITSFIYNVGMGKQNVSGFLDSTLLKRIKINPNDPDIRNQFNRWIYNDGKVMSDLIERRKLEADLYFK